MSKHRWITVAIAVGLVGLGPGCRSTPAVPDSAYGQTSQPAEQGWIYQQLVSRQPTGPLPDDDDAIRRASTDHPLSESYKVKADDDDSGFLSGLAPDHIRQTYRQWIGKGPNEGLAHALYQEGMDLYRDRRYDEAAAKFEEAGLRWPKSPLEEDSLFMLGESYFFADRYSSANDVYEQLIKEYQYTKHLDVVVHRLFAIGRYWEHLSMDEYWWRLNFTDKAEPLIDTFGYALRAFDVIRLNDPTGPLADASIMAQANAHFVRGQYEDAAYNYDLLRKEYAKSPYQVQAHLLGIKSKENIYQGPMYDATVLKDADQIAKQALSQFGPQLGNDRQYVVDTRNRIHEEMANRDLVLGQFYEKKLCYGSAKFYYADLIKNYPRTPAAEAARERLQQIKDYPDEPPNHFKWLTDLFGTKK
jgi:outer membrane protein assembly factor BamD (BamD/ComL family)